MPFSDIPSHYKFRVVDGLLTRVNKHQYLFTMLQHLSQDIVSHLIVDIDLLTTLSLGPLNRILDSHELLTQWNRSISLVEEEHTLLTDLKEHSHIPVVW